MTKTKRKPIDVARLLKRVGACEAAAAWCDGMSAKSAWTKCERGDWLLWIATRLKVDRKLVVLAACDCATTALKYVPKGEDRPRKAIETARAWTRGEATIEEVKSAADAADAADAAASAAAYAAAYAASAAADAYAATDAAAYAAADAAAYAAAAAARMKSFKKSANIVRRRISWEVIRKAAEGIS